MMGSGEKTRLKDEEPNDHLFSALDLGDLSEETKIDGRVGGGADPRDLFRIGPLSGEGELRCSLLSGGVSLRIFRWVQGSPISMAGFRKSGEDKAVVSFSSHEELLIEVTSGEAGREVDYALSLRRVHLDPLLKSGSSGKGLAIVSPGETKTVFQKILDQNRPERFLPEIIVDLSEIPERRARQREALRDLGLFLVSVGGTVELWRDVRLGAKRSLASTKLLHSLEIADLCRKARRALGSSVRLSPNLRIPLTSLASPVFGPRFFNNFLAGNNPLFGNGPNDPLYSTSQWNMPLAGFPAAWSLTHGSPKVTIAVLDTGVMIRHPDLSPRISKWSFDFVSDPVSAGDGDGVDSDPSEPPSFETLSLFHGTYVSGIAAAQTDNKQGVAGGTWAGKLLGLRIFGKKGNSSFDRIQALRYILGKSNTSGKILPKADRPQVVNMSFIELFPTQIEVGLIKEMACRNILMAAALGNEGKKLTQPHYPASWPEVIGVVAVGPDGKRAPYSNMASFADLAAPGGLEISGPKGVVSTWAATRNGKFQFGYNAFLGTSVATPHVTAALALLRSVYPAITKDKALAFLAQTAVDKGPKGKDIEYGFGLIDVGKAVVLAKSKWSPPQAGLNRAGINLGTQVGTTSMLLENRGGGVLQLDGIRPIGQHSGGLRLVPTCFIAPVSISILVDRSKVQPGRYSERFELDTNGGTVAIDISFAKEIPPPDGALMVRVLDGTRVLGETKAAKSGDFEIRSLPLGAFRLEAGIDRNRNGKLGDSQEWYLNIPIQVRENPPPNFSTLQVPWKK
jgi:subtilisin family serine protease